MVLDYTNIRGDDVGGGELKQKRECILHLHLKSVLYWYLSSIKQQPVYLGKTR